MAKSQASFTQNSYNKPVQKFLPFLVPKLLIFLFANKTSNKKSQREKKKYYR